MSKLNKKDRILILGNKGMVGSAIERKLISKNYQNVIGLNRKQLDLSIQNNLKKTLMKSGSTLLKKRTIIIYNQACLRKL